MYCLNCLRKRARDVAAGAMNNPLTPTYTPFLPRCHGFDQFFCLMDNECIMMRQFTADLLTSLPKLNFIEKKDLFQFASKIEWCIKDPYAIKMFLSLEPTFSSMVRLQTEMCPHMLSYLSYLPVERKELLLPIDIIVRFLKCESPKGKLWPTTGHEECTPTGMQMKIIRLNGEEDCIPFCNHMAGHIPIDLEDNVRCEVGAWEPCSHSRLAKKQIELFQPGPQIWRTANDYRTQEDTLRLLFQLEGKYVAQDVFWGCLLRPYSSGELMALSRRTLPAVEPLGPSRKCTVFHDIVSRIGLECHLAISVVFTVVSAHRLEFHLVLNPKREGYDAFLFIFLYLIERCFIRNRSVFYAIRLQTCKSCGVHADVCLIFPS